MIPFASMPITNAQRNVATWRHRYAADDYPILRNLLDEHTMTLVRHTVATALNRYGLLRTSAANRAVATNRTPPKTYWLRTARSSAAIFSPAATATSRRGWELHRNHIPGRLGPSLAMNHFRHLGRPHATKAVQSDPNAPGVLS